MSRCFPYPPPGYTLSRASNEALIESIKLQKEKERKKEKKERRKGKKEKRKEKKEKRKEKKDKTNQNSDKSDIQKHHISQKSLSDTKVDFLHKKREAETEQLEQSSLTEEHAARPASLSVPSISSDSTQNSNKRKRHSLPVDDTCGHGKVILIRLPSKKQNEFDALAKEEQQPCSTSGRSDSPAKSRDVNYVRDCPENILKGTNGIDQGFNLRNNPEQICSTSGPIETAKTGIKSIPKALLTPMQKMDLQYKNLLENCFPPQIQDACLYPDDLDWLLEGRNQDDQETTRAEKKRILGNDSLSCSRSSGLWPRAVYLREVDAYALPFTVPY